MEEGNKMFKMVSELLGGAETKLEKVFMAFVMIDISFLVIAVMFALPGSLLNAQGFLMTGAWTCLIIAGISTIVMAILLPFIIFWD